MLSFTGKIVFLMVVIITALAGKMVDNNTVCQKDCKFYSFPDCTDSHSNGGETIDINNQIFLEKHLLSFPCPPPWWPSLCIDLSNKQQLRISLSCQDITTILTNCLEQTHEDFYSNLLSDCKNYLKCQEFKSLCSSKKYTKYCVGGYDRANIVPTLVIDIEDNVVTLNKHMNNTTGIVMKPDGATDHYMYGSYNWHVLWVLLILVYILVFVPCFLNFVIKRSLIDRLRNRCQKSRKKTVIKDNCADDEPPLIPAVNKEVQSPVGMENSIYLPSRPDSMASTIGEDFDFPFADQSAAVSMVSLLIDEPR